MGASSRVSRLTQVVKMPAISCRYSCRDSFRKASFRLMSRPAPWGAEQFQSGLPLPMQIRLPSRMLMGISSFSPARAETAPLRRIICSVSI